MNLTGEEKKHRRSRKARKEIPIQSRVLEARRHGLIGPCARVEKRWVDRVPNRLDVLYEGVQKCVYAERRGLFRSLTKSYLSPSLRRLAAGVSKNYDPTHEVNANC